MQTVGAAVAADPLILLPGLLVMGLLTAGLTLIYTFLITLGSNRKKQLATAGLLFAAMLLFFTVPFSFPDPTEPEFIIFPLAALSLAPLSAIITGVLWFWPAKRDEILKTTILCAVAAFFAGVLAFHATAVIASPSQGGSYLAGFLNFFLLVPMGASIVYLALFSGASALACLVYLLMRAAGARGLPGWLKGWMSVKGQKNDQ